MKPDPFFHQLDEARIVAAIREAERLTSGEIRVFVSRNRASDPLAKARARFRALGMERTRERNAILIYLAPRSQKFAVIGDEGVHARCGDPFWSELAAAMEEALRTHRFTEAVVLAVERCGVLLARFFPVDPENPNELPDSVGRD